MTYHALNRVKQIARPVSDTDPTQQTTTLSYERLRTAVTDAEGKTTSLVKDALNRAGFSGDSGV